MDDAAPQPSLNLLARVRRKIGFKLLHRLLRDPDFSIVSNNCWGAHVYQHLGRPYRTPFVGVFILPGDYLTLVADLRSHLAMPMTFTPHSKFDPINARRAEKTGQYPIGRLGDVEIHFLHEHDEAVAGDKWKRRCERLTRRDDRLFFKFCDYDSPSVEQLETFDRLPLKNKIAFVAAPRPTVRCAVTVPQIEDGHVPDGIGLIAPATGVFDTAKWIATGDGRRTIGSVLRPKI